MNVLELRFGTISRLRALTTEWTRVADGKSGCECQLALGGHGRNSLLIVAGTSIGIEPATPADENVLADLQQRNLPVICSVLSATSGAAQFTELFIQVHEFPACHRWPRPLPLLVDERVVADIERRYFARPTPPMAICAWLSEQCVLPPPLEGEMSRAFISAGATAPTSGSAPFRLHGTRVAVDFRPEADGALRIHRVVASRGKGAVNSGRIELIEGHFAFSDRTAATVVQRELRGQLKSLVERADSLLRLWGDYNDLERRLVEEKRVRCGALRYKKCQARDDGTWQFLLDVSSDERLRAAEVFTDGSVDSLEALRELPDDLLTQGDPDPGPAELPTSWKAPTTDNFAGKLAKSDWHRGIVELVSLTDDESEPPSQGYLTVSARGDQTRLDRRERARARIVIGSNPLPQLGLILEGQPAPSAVYRRHQPWSPAARRALAGEPTLQQTQAMDVALNTPDIALVQGPPGTGKTRLIAALQVRLAELAEEGRATRGHILLTSYQHDAVEHAAEATTVYGLPAVKLGYRKERVQHRDAVEVWRRERLGRVRATLDAMGGAPIAAVVRRLQELQIAYASAPGGRLNAAFVLREASNAAERWISADLRERVRQYADKLQLPVSTLQNGGWLHWQMLTRALRAIRTTSESYADDGQSIMARLRYLLAEAKQLTPEVAALLDTCESAGTPNLSAIARWRDEMLDVLLDREKAQHLSVGDRTTELLLAEMAEELTRIARTSSAGIPDVLDDFAQTLASDVDAVQRAIVRHTPVLAATCQQSVGQAMRTVIEAAAGSRDTVQFETVIVDEAARANPLDLFIPLSLARRRVVLVGDHRQLPHILEPEVERALRGDGGEVQSVFRRSLFEVLFEDKLPAQTRADGVARVVTLDTQYRMHPVLGDFVSTAFYEGRLRSGRAPEDFVHAIQPFAGRVAGWIDVTNRGGRTEEQPGASKSRPLEADVVAQHLEALIGQDCAANLTFGVITFYRAQEDAIWRAFEAHGLAERQENGRYQVVGRVNQTTSGRERLHVGTVDAFQGKEFDVVLLSMARSNRIVVTASDDMRRKYGHLALPNRLCVSMSRQRRLLVVVGDSAMLEGPAAQAAVPGLVAFRKLCEGPYGRCF